MVGADMPQRYRGAGGEASAHGLAYPRPGPYFWRCLAVASGARYGQVSVSPTTREFAAFQ